MNKCFFFPPRNKRKFCSQAFNRNRAFLFYWSLRAQCDAFRGGGRGGGGVVIIIPKRIPMIFLQYTLERQTHKSQRTSLSHSHTLLHDRDMIVIASWFCTH